MLAERMKRLGTENAFQVALRAMKHQEEGNTVYPFHLGDLNFKTPEPITEAMFKAVHDGKTGYCPAAGILPLRTALAEEINRTRKTGYTPENVLVQTGGKPVIAKFLLGFMSEGDEVLFPNPGFPIYESFIEFLGGIAKPYGFLETERGYSIDIDALEKSITPQTKCIIINDFQNPTGSEASKKERERLAEIILKYKLMALIDEAYFDIRYEGKSVSMLEIEEIRDNCVLLYTFSKKFAMTGWRVGAMFAPTQYIPQLSKLNVNIESCTPHFTQYGALEALKLPESENRKIIDALRLRRDAAVKLLNEVDGVHCPSPNCAFYLYPNVTKLMHKKGFGDDYKAFAEDVLVKTGVSFCTREHFGKKASHETENFIRLAFSGVNCSQIEKACQALKEYAK